MSSGGKLAVTADLLDVGEKLDEDLSKWSLEELAWQPGALVRCRSAAYARRNPRARAALRSV